MDIYKYKETQDLVEEFEKNNFTGAEYEGSDAYIRNYLNENNIKFQEIEGVKRNKFQLFYNDSPIVKYSHGKYPNNAFIGLRIANNKLFTEYYLRINDIPTPKYQLFTEQDQELALEFIKSIDSLAVIKPKDLSQSVGVYTDVNESNFKECWLKCIEIQKKYRPHQEVVVMVQEQIDGFELRVNVAEGEVLNVLLKLPWVLEGDGKKTIEDFIIERNNEVRDSPIYPNLEVKVNNDLKERLAFKNKSLTSVLGEGELFMISNIPLSRLGSRKFNVAHMLHPNILKLGVDAIKAIPGLQTGGVDLFIPSLDSDTGVILEINKNPGNETSIYPIVGEPQNLYHETIKSYMIDQKVLHEDIEDLNDLSKEELNILLKRYKFLYEKNKLNTKIITHFHKEYIEDFTKK